MEHLACVDTVCLADKQVFPARYEQRRINRPPTASSGAMVLANQLSVLATGTSNYLDLMSTETRYEAQRVLNQGLQEWQQAMMQLDDMLETEIQRRLDSFNPPPTRPATPEIASQQFASDVLERVKRLGVLLDRAKSEKSSRKSGRRHSSQEPQKKRSPSQRLVQVAFPSTEDEYSRMKMEDMRVERNIASPF